MCDDCSDDENDHSLVAETSKNVTRYVELRYCRTSSSAAAEFTQANRYYSRRLALFQCALAMDGYPAHSEERGKNETEYADPG